MDEYRLKRNAGYDTLQIRTYENEDGSELPVLKYPELESWRLPNIASQCARAVSRKASMLR